MNYEEEIEKNAKVGITLTKVFLLILVIASISIFLFAYSLTSQQEDQPPMYQEVPVYHDSDPYRP